ncbi:MAG: hypothetical protein IPO45_02040 [Saprospiraceae bacterium]|nr:hypothetical protein [Candidatus Brachybacter algidus]
MNWLIITQNAKNEMKAGHDFIFNISEALCKENVTISSADLFVRLKEYLNLKYNWINEDNLYRLMSQGCYYAYKEGYDGIKLKIQVDINNIWTKYTKHIP